MPRRFAVFAITVVVCFAALQALTLVKAYADTPSDGSLLLKPGAPSESQRMAAGAGILLTKTVGLDSSVCATNDSLVIASTTTVFYCYEVENTGDITLTRHNLTDSELGGILSNFPFTLVPGATAFLTQSAVISQTTVNIATWTAFVPQGPSASATDSATVTLGIPTIDMTKTVGTDSAVCAITDEITVTVGTVVTYCYEVENTGSVTVTRHDLEDSELGIILTNFPFTLVPGASAFITQSATITQSTTNIATWTAYNPAAPTASATDTATVHIPNTTAVSLNGLSVSSSPFPTAALAFAGVLLLATARILLRRQ